MYLPPVFYYTDLVKCVDMDIALKRKKFTILKKEDAKRGENKCIRRTNTEDSKSSS
jgi:hypothetical protein